MLNGCQYCSGYKIIQTMRGMIRKMWQTWTLISLTVYVLFNKQVSMFSGQCKEFKNIIECMFIVHRLMSVPLLLLLE